MAAGKWYLRSVKKFLHYRVGLELILGAGPQFILERMFLVLFINFKVKIIIFFFSKIASGKSTNGGNYSNMNVDTKVQNINWNVCTL